MYEGARIRVEQQAYPATRVRAFDINIGNGCLDIHYGLLIRVGFNANINRVSGLPFLATASAQIVLLEMNTEVVPKDIKIVVEN